jgi:hypothetical protein
MTVCERPFHPFVPVTPPARNKLFTLSLALIINEGGNVMPRGDTSKYTDKQERKADHIAESYEDRGASEKEAERRACAFGDLKID